ncbi:hypothetical protein [Arthrobacter sp. FW306-06-A]|uniref:hypothetical protein n=1 Tax=Arthrobacter sp. FW306-06-A TaxID=2879621 RepID=UPI001F1AFDDC|nr:hypothetical protein [Arthrobacter sp. FW306-06-A]UKA69599.1 hypothetical protein LFT49_12530 [Arthrobacter sp. FW306-06-A]
MDLMEEMRRTGAVRAAQLLDPRPLVHVRAVYGRAIAVTPTHVLHEWVRFGEYHCRWDAKWQVKQVSLEEWFGDSLD